MAESHWPEVNRVFVCDIDAVSVKQHTVAGQVFRALEGPLASTETVMDFESAYVIYFDHLRRLPQYSWSASTYLWMTQLETGMFGASSSQ